MLYYVYLIGGFNGIMDEYAVWLLNIPPKAISLANITVLALNVSDWSSGTHRYMCSHCSLAISWAITYSFCFASLPTCTLTSSYLNTMQRNLHTVFATRILLNLRQAVSRDRVSRPSVGDFTVHRTSGQEIYLDTTTLNGC